MYSVLLYMFFFLDVVMFDACQAYLIHLHSTSRARPLLWLHGFYFILVEVDKDGNPNL